MIPCPGPQRGGGGGGGGHKKCTGACPIHVNSKFGWILLNSLGGDSLTGHSDGLI